MKNLILLIISLLLLGCNNTYEDLEINKHEATKKEITETLQEKFDSFYNSLSMDTPPEECLEFFFENIPFEMDKQLAEEVMNVNNAYKIMHCINNNNFYNFKKEITHIQDSILCLTDKTESSKYLLFQIDLINISIDFLLKNKSKIEIIKFLASHSVEERYATAEKSYNGTLEDGMYRYPMEKNKYLNVFRGYAWVHKCGIGLVFSPESCTCVFDTGITSPLGAWWERWGRCITEVVAGTIVGGLGGGVEAGGVGIAVGAISQGLLTYIENNNCHE